MSYCYSQESVRSKEDEGKEAPFTIFFVKLGHDLFQKRIDILTRSAQWKGATVITEFRYRDNNKKNSENVPPITHLVISEQITSIEQVAKALRFPSKQQLEDYIEERRLVSSDRDNTNAIDHGTTINAKAVLRASGAITSSPADGQRSTTYLTKINCNNNNNSTVLPTPTNTNTKTTRRPTMPQHNNNYELSELFLKLAKLHQDCPLLGKLDQWKAYCFNLVAGRIRHLPFDIPRKKNEDDYYDDNNVDANTKRMLQELSQIRGFGKSTVQKIQEYISTGKISRIREFHCDPSRMAMKNMMNIWGIGSVRAYQLVQQGYTNIKQIRKAIKSNELFLERNQLIGVDIYEDILEKMTREEVEQIGAAISNAVQYKFQQLSVAPQQQEQEKGDPTNIITPRPEITIMGSYRRGKEGCGDVDVLITSKEYFDTIHPTILGEIVDYLCNSGHIAYHLTFINGMKDKNHSGNNISDNKRNERKNVKIMDDDSTTSTGTDNDSSNDDEEGSIEQEDTLFSSSQAIGNSQGSLWVKRRVKEQREYHEKVRREQQQSYCSQVSPTSSPSSSYSCSSYMGVFVSPTTGKRRRVDIKFYPYRERVFATLYFTGNGHFNRSMRLWAKRKFNYTLNDHGLFISNKSRQSQNQQHHDERVAVILRKSDHNNHNTSNSDTVTQNNIATTTVETTTSKIATAATTASEKPTTTGTSCRAIGKNEESPDQETITNFNENRAVRIIEKGEEQDDEDDLIVIPVVETEKQVFDFLQLEYKEPWERDCFDAVVGKQHNSGRSSFASSSSSSILLSESDFYKDTAQHAWID